MRWHDDMLHGVRGGAFAAGRVTTNRRKKASFSPSSATYYSPPQCGVMVNINSSAQTKTETDSSCEAVRKQVEAHYYEHSSEQGQPEEKTCFE